MEEEEKFEQRDEKKARDETQQVMKTEGDKEKYEDKHGEEKNPNLENTQVREGRG